MLTIFYELISRIQVFFNHSRDNDTINTLMEFFVVEYETREKPLDEVIKARILSIGDLPRQIEVELKSLRQTKRTRIEKTLINTLASSIDCSRYCFISLFRGTETPDDTINQTHEIVRDMFGLFNEYMTIIPEPNKYYKLIDLWKLWMESVFVFNDVLKSLDD